jgi:hypothetical protein
MNMGDLKPILTILLVFLIPALVVVAVLVYRLRRQRLILEAIQKLADKGVTIPPELLQSLSSEWSTDRAPTSYLRRAILMIASGAGLGIVLWEAGNGRDSWVFAMIPWLLGVGYLVIWKLEQRGTR